MPCPLTLTEGLGGICERQDGGIVGALGESRGGDGRRVESALEVFRGGSGSGHPMTQRLAQPGLADCAEIDAAGQMPALATGAVAQPEDAQIDDVPGR